MFPYIELFGDKLGSYPLCVGMALLTIVLVVRWQQRRISLALDFENKIMIAVPLSMACGALAGCLSDIAFRGGWQALTRPGGFGFTFYGWLIGCMAFYWVYAKGVRLAPSLLLNLFLPAFSLAQAWGRIGCFCGGCCYGKPLAGFGVVFPEGSLPHLRYGNMPLAPVQLLEAAYLLVIFVILFAKVPFAKRAAWYLLLMPAGRFTLEFLRGDDRGDVFGIAWLSPAQWLSIVFCGAGLVMLHRREGLATVPQASPVTDDLSLRSKR